MDDGDHGGEVDSSRPAPYGRSLPPSISTTSRGAAATPPRVSSPGSASIPNRGFGGGWGIDPGWRITSAFAPNRGREGGWVAGGRRLPKL